ncbi:sulfatase [Tropicimonas isoalkanivorans]|uniref:Arylsulfatase A n=1 Tax=Tropicimonas isoalkanivorans TaxID=441112 RepID=A0A1I1N1R0_9RHOB|nr:sulfatase [Tropicimonas isoalkanivorans]SFC91276.1 Arylsulfatase A [Tropicimonas isoalkanivorans]
MRTIFVLFDSLNRSALGAYGGTEVATPNFDRFAALGVAFDTHYVGSMPCMPARRDLHTGRLNFMHRSWGPMEPYDRSFVRQLSQAGVHTHLVSDHLHYFEDGGHGFHTKFDSYDFIRGQEYDPWVALVQPPVERIRSQFDPRHYNTETPDKHLQHAINRQRMEEEEQMPGPRCFASAFRFLDDNRTADDWFLMLECFDPHEPFHAPERFKDTYRTGYEGRILDWPHYERVAESPEEIDEIRANYAALVAMCDEYFGRLLDYLDTHGMWEDTCLVLGTDHGFLLSEHGWWGKARMPYYEEISHIPLVVHHPAHTAQAGTRRDALTQTTDLMPTFLEVHGLDVPGEARATSLWRVVEDPKARPRDAAVFGVFSGPIGVTDGQHVLYHYPPDIFSEGLVEYTLAPNHMTEPFTPEELRTARLAPAFDFTQGIPLLAIDATAEAKRPPNNDGIGFDDLGTRLYDLVADPAQQNPIRDDDIQSRLEAAMIADLQRHDTPEEFYRWYGLHHRSSEGRIP